MDELKEFNKILVTGPQRSGTTICAKILSEDFDLEFFPEEKFGIRNKEAFAGLVKNQNNFVVQCPAVSRYIHEIADDTMAVVWMLRDFKDIAASEKRINWTDWHERNNYQAHEDSRSIAEIKYHYWLKVQKRKITNAFEMRFEDLKTHELFLPENIREGFAPRQIEL